MICPCGSDNLTQYTGGRYRFMKCRSCHRVAPIYYQNILAAPLSEPLTQAQRIQMHDWIDPLWKQCGMRRVAVYNFLADVTNYRRSQLHVAEMNRYLFNVAGRAIYWLWEWLRLEYDRCPGCDHVRIMPGRPTPDGSGFGRHFRCPCGHWYIAKVKGEPRHGIRPGYLDNIRNETR